MGAARVDSPFRLGKGYLLAKSGERCGIASGKTIITLLIIKVRAGRIFAGRF
jgi:hypothetical protein